MQTERCTGVVYNIKLSRGNVYIGQTSRCVNERLNDHALSVRSSPASNLAVHCDRRGCQPVLEKTSI